MVFCHKICQNLDSCGHLVWATSLTVVSMNGEIARARSPKLIFVIPRHTFILKRPSWWRASKESGCFFLLRSFLQERQGIHETVYGVFHPLGLKSQKSGRQLCSRQLNSIHLKTNSMCVDSLNHSPTPVVSLLAKQDGATCCCSQCRHLH